MRLLPMSNAMRYDLPDFSTPAVLDTVKSSCSAACVTFARVAGVTLSGWAKVLETVAIETPASVATSLILFFDILFPSDLLPLFAQI